MLPALRGRGRSGAKIKKGFKAQRAVVQKKKRSRSGRKEGSCDKNGQQEPEKERKAELLGSKKIKAERGMIKFKRTRVKSEKKKE